MLDQAQEQMPSSLFHFPETSVMLQERISANNATLNMLRARRLANKAPKLPSQISGRGITRFACQSEFKSHLAMQKFQPSNSDTWPGGDAFLAGEPVLDKKPVLGAFRPKVSLRISFPPRPQRTFLHSSSVSSVWKRSCPGCPRPS